ncbi:hypothetical protein QQ054_36460 [Oscillatoria amoena NRMC-F 0135]|nr:hypothetical protein [Oscillatoria amoena NRMC-F 0135]
MNTIDLNAYTVVTAQNGKTYWNKLGAAFQFETADGRTGFNIPNLNIVVIQPKEEQIGIQPEVDIERLSEV